MRGFWCSGDSTSQRILDVLESFYLRLWKIIVQCCVNYVLVTYMHAEQKVAK